MQVNRQQDLLEELAEEQQRLRRQAGKLGTQVEELEEQKQRQKGQLDKGGLWDASGQLGRRDRPVFAVKHACDIAMRMLHRPRACPGAQRQPFAEAPRVLTQLPPPPPPCACCV